MNKFYTLLILMLLFVGCKESEKKEKLELVFQSKIELPGESRPLSLVKNGEEIWFSDPENFRVLKVNTTGRVLDSIVGIERPMNIHFNNGFLYVPEFLTDSLWSFKNDSKNQLSIDAQPDAPASIFVKEDTIAVADFYGHRIILKIKDKLSYISEEGHDEGQLYYPTDVKIKNNRIYVADAYNHRVQVFDVDGKFLQLIGSSAGINVASGIDIKNNLLAVTDQENSRVLIYNLEGELLQTLDKKINYPTDVLWEENTLYLTNFKENTITVYGLK